MPFPACTRRALWPSRPAADGSPQEGGGSRWGTQTQKRARPLPAHPQLQPQEPAPLTQASWCVSQDSARAMGTSLGSRRSGGETAPSSPSLHPPSPIPHVPPGPQILSSAPSPSEAGSMPSIPELSAGTSPLGSGLCHTQGWGHQAHLQPPVHSWFSLALATRRALGTLWPHLLEPILCSRGGPGAQKVRMRTQSAWSSGPNQ